ncbi:hypothetical protein MSKU3_0477 [Komagataeibacter oboediens]|nr:hypothetical protein MSKU3_0477 [Komagataeibacter oboediens]
MIRSARFWNKEKIKVFGYHISSKKASFFKVFQQMTHQNRLYDLPYIAKLTLQAVHNGSGYGLGNHPYRPSVNRVGTHRAGAAGGVDSMRSLSAQTSASARSGECGPW